MRLLIEASFAVTPTGLERDVAVLVEDGLVAAVEPRAVLADAPVEARLGGPGQLLLPGLVNAHQHGRPRSTVALGVPDAPLECWLVGLLGIPRTDPYADALAVGRRLVGNGVTTTVHAHATGANDAAGYDAEIRALLRGYRDAGVRGIVAVDLRDRGLPFYGDQGRPPSLPAGAAEMVRTLPTLDEALEVFDGVRADAQAGRLGDVDVILGPPGPGWCSEPLLRAVAARSERDAVGVHTHLLETRYQAAFARAEYGVDGVVAALARFGLLTSRLFCAHGVWLTAGEREQLAAAGVSLVTNPSSNLRLHAGVAAVRELLAAGVNMALGTDSMALDDDDSLLGEVRLLRALQRRQDIDDPGLDARTALKLATRGGAWALNRDDLGVLQVGASADLALVDLERLRPPGSPVDPLELVVATASREHLDVVLRAGQVVAVGGEAVAPASVSLPRFRPGSADAARAPAASARDHYRAWPVP